MWHYAVVIGFDAPRQEFILRSGETAEQRLSTSVFNHLWQRSNYWGFVLAAPAQRLPEFAQIQQVLEQAIGMERVSAELAAHAYLQAAAKWPENPGFYFGAGNALLQSKQPQMAVIQYQNAVKTQPDFGDAWNNLAEAWGALGNTVKAKKAAHRAVEIGGAHALVYQETLRKFSQ
ncbi:MAG: tetratricopeptide repeat protein [Limnobacter sp.]|nr:tetratricopeptide repeat protein [Limnobacter sp.]